MVKRHQQLAAYLQKVDARDLSFKTEDGTFDALELLKKLPDDPKEPSLFDHLLDSRVPILQYEDLLARLRYIERTVEARATERKTSARKSWDQAVADNADLLKLYQAALGNWRSPTDIWVDGQQTIERCDKVVTDLSADLVKAKTAVALDGDLAPSYAALKTTLDARISDATQLKAQAKQGLDDLRKRLIRVLPHFSPR